MKWFLDHWQLIGLVLLGIVRLIIWITPSVKDDKYFDKVLLRFIISLLMKKK